MSHGQSLVLSLALVFGSFSLGYILSSTLHVQARIDAAKTSTGGDILPPADGTGPGTNHPVYGTEQDYKAAIRELKDHFRTRDEPAPGEDAAADGTKGNEVGVVEVSTHEGDLESHGGSEWSYHGEYRPSVVVFVKR
jgi:hypothetical protein